MEFINTVLGTPLGFIIYFAYWVFGNYGLAIVAFAIIVKIPVFPVMVLAHKNSIRLLQLQPALYLIKQRHAGDKESISEAQYELFKKEKYSPLIGIAPLIVQLFLVMGMLQVMYHPLQHMLRLEQDTISSLVQVMHGIYGANGGFVEQLTLLEAFQHPENWPAFQSALAGFYYGESIFSLIQETNLHFVGLNLGATPSFRNPSLELVIVLLSGIVALAFCLIQNAISPGALSQSKRTNLGLTLFTVGLSLYFALMLPVGVGLYWTVGNLAAIGVVLLLNYLYPPKKLASEALIHLRATRKTPEQLQKENLLQKELRKREKADVNLFNSAKKQVVFYAISSGQYKYYAEIIEYILHNSNITIHYLTNDPNDALFQNSPIRLIPYYVGHQKTISVMMKLETSMMITTVPDIQHYHIKRSVAQKDIEYIYVFHGFTSLHMVMRPGALDYYDTVFCVGPHHVNEIRRSEELRNTSKKKLIKAGYGVFDRLLTKYSIEQRPVNEKPMILIAPSWQNGNIMESCIDIILKLLCGQGYQIIIRPHPQYIKNFDVELTDLQERHSNHIESGEIKFEVDFGESSSMYLSDIVITDWSNTAYEFSFCTKKPSIFINTPMKVLNPNYKDLCIEPSDIYLRDKAGISVDITNLDTLNDLVVDILKNNEVYREKITKTVKDFMYYPMRSGEAGGKYIINQYNLRS